MMEQNGQGRQPFWGEITFTDITDVSDLFLPMEPDAWGVPRAPFSKTMARLSAELTADSANLDITPWVKAGWEDCTFVVEDRIIVLDTDTESKFAALEHEWRRYRAKSLIHGVRPIGDLVRAARQVFITDMGKAIIMTRMMPNGRAVVAIAFIGTSQKYFDWFSNFKFQQHNGMHYGFGELARQFDTQAERILLPGLAAALGEETLSLADVLLELKKTDGRFMLWLSGHSQGGALVQTYTHMLMSRGVPAENIRGYTFGAPTVAAADGRLEPKQFPIYHIVNADDIVPRVGAQVRLGMDLIYFPDDRFRAAHYMMKAESNSRRNADGIPAEEIPTGDTPAESREVFERAMYMTKQIQTTRDAICCGIALMRLLGKTGGDELMRELLADVIPRASLLKRMGFGMEDMAQYFHAKLEEQYHALTGEAPDAALCARYEDTMRTFAADLGPRPFARMTIQCLVAPHRLKPEKKYEGFVTPYVAIARRYLDETVAGVWQPDQPLRCLSQSGETLLPQREFRPRLMAEEPPKALPESSDDTPNT